MNTFLVPESPSGDRPRLEAIRPVGRQVRGERTPGVPDLRSARDSLPTIDVPCRKLVFALGLALALRFRYSFERSSHARA